MESLIGHTVINLSDESLSEDQVSALEKRSLYHFYNDNKHLQNLNEDEMALVDFMAMNLEENENPHHEIHKKFMDKSTWRPPRIHQSLEVFQRAFKDGLLKSKVKTRGQQNLMKKQMIGLKELSTNRKIVIKKRIRVQQ